MDRRDEETSTIAWPGFVDILSAVIIMFVFFVMITAIVMYALSVEHQEEMAEQNEQRVEAMVTEEVQEVVERIAAGEISIDDLKKSFEYEQEVKTLEQNNQKLTKDKLTLEHDLEMLSGQIEQITADFSQNLEQNSQVTDGYFVVLFTRNDISLSNETTNAIDEFLKEEIKKRGNKPYRIQILGADNPEAPTLSTARERSLARALNVRNIVIEQKIDPTLIAFKYVKPEKIGDSYNWVKIGVIEP